jgi:Predicted membrane protein
MNRADFMKELERGLKKLSREEVLDALQYYNDYFDDIGVENESKAIINLGPPQKVAAQIKAESYINVANEEQKKLKMGMKTIQIAILMILASPIALPLAGGAIATVVALLASIYLVYLSFFLVGSIFVVMAICAVPISIVTCFLHFPSAVAILGGGLVCLGSGYLCLLGTFILIKETYKWTIKKAANKIKRRPGR